MRLLSFLSVLWLIGIFLFPHKNLQAQNNQSDLSQIVRGLKLREIGPSVMGGRISDIAIHPQHPSTWYVSAGSGNLWKTTNSGITWKPIFEDYPSYSIGAIAIDPTTPETVWLGTGENVSGRHVGWGSGIYRSRDGGKSWKQMGLEKSEHIGKILVDPRNSDVVIVAAEGPLWSSGGERGVYKTTDGGQKWKQMLEIDEHTGVTDLEFDPTNPDIVYAAAYQRRRHTWALLAGGPQSGIYKSTNNGDSWRKITKGLPKGDMGKIGLAVTPADPSLIYATIEASNAEKGFYRSIDKGESWEKRNSYVSGGTGPHYYQEIEVSPVDPDLIYQMDVFLHVSRDGGKTFDYLVTGREKHSDNHALWIDPQNGQHLMAGCDGGLYETFDEGKTWRHFPNLPISQFYKLALDNSEPFYNILGGAQDLGTLLGPSRTMHTEGIRNQDWYVPTGADGYESQFDPEDPNIAYMEFQQGYLFRYDRRLEQPIKIQPQPAPGDAPERWNWDSPLIISPHSSKRLYFGSQRVWKSDDRGDSWSPISKDLTTNTNRYELEMMGRVWRSDALYDNGAMSKYATLTCLSESPKVEDLLYTGSDDGLIQVTEDGGSNWRKTAELPGVPWRSFINDVEASTHDENTVFAVGDAHKFGDYSPYLFMSTDRGKVWRSIAGDLPDKTIVWVIKQDRLDENLLFIGTEYGLYFSPNKGKNWIKLNGGVPTIPFRDIELHPREDDIVGATFGRGFYVLDDYSCLRNLSEAVAAKTNTLFPVRDAWWYIPSVPMQAKGMPSAGSTSYAAENPPFGATFTYYMADIPQTTKQQRQEKEKVLRKEEASIPFPAWETLREESTEATPKVMLWVKDEAGNPIRWLKGAGSKGLHRTTWDLRLPAPNAINLTQRAFNPPWASDPQGPMAAPGTYSVQLFILHQGEMVAQGEAQKFALKPVPGIAEDMDFEAVAAFQQKTHRLLLDMSSAGQKLGESKERLGQLEAALMQTPKVTAEHFATWQALDTQLIKLRTTLYGDPILGRFDEARPPSIYSRAQNVAGGHWSTTQAPTKTFQNDLKLATEGYTVFKKDLQAYLQDLEAFETSLKEAGSPYTKGRKFGE
ncbi:MAG: glycosyl hydrolase [Bacteroidota bacterium]